jgi:DNA-binding helix-hairpin-helix protein with protein kinase domain
MALKQYGPIRVTNFSVVQIVTFCDGAHRQLAAAYMEAETTLTRAIEEWRTRIGVWKTYRKCAELEEKARLFKFLVLHRAYVEAQELEKLRRHGTIALLRSKVIANSSIPGISRGLGSRLAAIGAVSAADLFRIDIARLRGIGASRLFSLLLWRDALAVEAQRALRADPQSASGTEVGARSRYLERVTEVEAEIEKALCDLDMHVTLVRSAVRFKDTAVAQAYAQLEQAACDLRCLGYDPPCPKGV